MTPSVSDGSWGALREPVTLGGVGTEAPSLVVLANEDVNVHVLVREMTMWLPMHPSQLTNM